VHRETRLRRVGFYIFPGFARSQAFVTKLTEGFGCCGSFPKAKGTAMKRLIILLGAVVLFSTAAKAEWTPGTLLLGRFQQELHTVHDPKELTTAGICSRLKSQLIALVPWSKQTESNVRP
jgi:hypothetical protein